MINRNRVRLSKLALGLAIALATAPAFAQNTSSAVGGQISDASGQPVGGAQVTILHTESGTVSNATSGADGRYVARGLRVGGPYTITISKDGKTEKREGVYLQLAETGNVDATLGGSAVNLDAVVVVGSAASVFNPNAMGAGTALSEDQIQAFASIKRDLQDYARLDPRISQTDKERGEISALGQNSRFNSITIDSVSVNDTFGVEANNLPTVRQPISLDAIESVQINVTNYDVTQKGYTGANINAVTKSGTNNFKGSVYGTYRTKDWVRQKDDRGISFNRFEDETTYGATFGGPILKDRLFFFVNYDKSVLAGTAPDLGGGPFGNGRITEQNVIDVQTEARRRGIDPGELRASFGDTEVESLLARIDWNINDDHRAAFRFSRTEQSLVVLPGFGTNFFSLSSYWFNENVKFDNAVAEVFSDWSDSFSTEARVSYRDYFATPVVFKNQPQIQVDFGSANFRFGAEQFRHVNVRETKTLNTYLAGNLFMGDHTLKFGVDYDSNDIENQFIESNFGQYRFGSLANFRAGTYREYVVRVSKTGNNEDAIAKMKLDNLGLFVQDIWTFNNNLTVNAGLRWDKSIVDDVPPFNQAAFNAFGYRNDVTIDGKSLLQPRFGFNYTFDSDRQTQLRGGVGLFQGAAANVWLINPFTNSGTTIDIFGCGFAGSSTNCTTALATANPFSADPNNQPRFGTARADVDLLAPDVVQPSVWKANLAFEHELPFWGAVFSAEVVLTSVKDGLYYEHLNLGRTRAGYDGRNLYWASTAPGLYSASSGFFGPQTNARNGANSAFREVMLARNTNKGEGQNLTVSLSKPLSKDNEWFWSLSYAFTEATEVNGLSSSRAISNWASRSIYNPNEEVSSRSSYVVRDRFNATLGWEHNFFGGYKSKFALFYEGRKGKPYSWTFQNDMNGDGLAGNDLMYIPRDASEIRFTTPSEEAMFWQIVSDNGLGSYRGGVVPRNSAFAPWTNSFDLRVTQELPGFFEGNKAEIYLDLQNVGNLLNKDWGRIDEIFFQSSGGQARSFVNFAGVDPNGHYVYDVVNLEKLGRRDNSGESRWAVQLGFRYEF